MANNILKIILFSLPIIVFILIILDNLNSGPYGSDLLLILSREDGPVEYSTSLAYFLSFLFSMYIGRSFLKLNHNVAGIIYLCAGLGFLFISLEEISWGQRIFDFETPQLFSSNLQNEVSIHNFPSFQKFVPLAFLAISMIGGLLGFVLRRVYSGTKNNFVINCFSPHRFLTSFFLVPFVFFFIWIFIPAEYTYPYTFVTPSGEETRFFPLKIFDAKHQEIFEFVLITGILIHISSIFKLHKIRANLKII